MSLTRKPRRGDRLGFRRSFDGPDLIYGTVVATPEGEDTLCWWQQDGRPGPEPFIWYFPRDGQFNQLATILPPRADVEATP